MSEIKPERFIRMLLSDLVTPKNGRIVMADRWWAITNEGEALFFGSYTSPQCNTNPVIVERIANGIKTTPTFVPFAYVPHKCSDYFP